MRSTFSRWKMVFWGILVLWAASIAFALQTKTLFTPANYPIGSDPSFDIAVAVFLLMLGLLGAVLIWRGLLAGQNKLEGSIRRLLNLATFVNVGLLAIVFVTVGLLFSANSAFARGYKPLVINEPRPDYSFPAFPTPFDPQPTPTDAPGAVLLSGNILSALDGFRNGEISISLSPTGDTIEYIQLHIYRITCQVQQGGAVTAYAVDDSKPLIRGPLRIQNGTFFAAQGISSIQGIFASPQSVHGSLFLRYTDPATNQSCDLGSFTWSAAPV